MVNGKRIEKSEVNMSKHRLQSTDDPRSGAGRTLSMVKNEEGIVLVVALLLLLVATVVGITALSTTTTNVMIAGNQRLQEICFSAADSGISVSSPVIDLTSFDSAVPARYLPLVVNPIDFVNDILGTTMLADDPTVAPDILFPLGGATTVSVDVDYLYVAAAAGSAIEFASGYEGLGKGMSGGGGEIYYAVTSVGECDAGAQNAVCSIYRYIMR